MKKAFDFLKVNKVYTPEEQAKKDKIKLLVYVAFFLILIIALRISNPKSYTNAPIKNEDNTNNKTDQVIKLLDKFKDNNYEININIVKDKDMINVVKRIQDKDTEIFYIKYRGNENMYFRHKENYFIVNGESVTKTTKYDKIFEYDETFLDMNNLIKLLENNNKNFKDLTEEKYLIRRYKVPLTEVLKTYNEIHGTEEFTSLIKEVAIDIRYKSNELVGIYLNMVYLNNYLKEANDTVFTYDLTFTDIGTINLNSLVEASNNL